LKEEYLLTGPLEPTNDAYAIAKIAGIKHVQAVRKQYGKPWISVMPTNLYGPGDNYTEGESHVMAALIKRFVEAKRDNLPSVTNWGTGSPLREFMHVDDLAEATYHLIENYDSSIPINIGSGDEISIRDLSTLIQKSVGYEGQVNWDETKPDGVIRKALDNSRYIQTGGPSSGDLSNNLLLMLGKFQADDFQAH
jgi:GDP-L-fucose synthase